MPHLMCQPDLLHNTVKRTLNMVGGKPPDKHPLPADRLFHAEGPMYLWDLISWHIIKLLCSCIA